MAFCIRASEYDHELYDIVSGPSESCLDCGVEVPTPEGSNIKLDSIISDDDDVSVSIIFSQVDQEGMTTIARSFTDGVFLSDNDSGRKNSFIVTTTSLFTGNVLLELTFPAAISEDNFDRVHTFVIDSGEAYDTTFLQGSQ